MRRTRSLVFILCWLSASPAFAEDPSPSQAAAAQFVQQFYDWYRPMARKHGKAPSWIVALNKRGADFDPGLTRALREDADAQALVSNDIVGLDFDPFLNVQDLGDKYAVGNATEKDGVFLVGVYAVRKGKRAAKPDVVAELKASRGALLFTNFRYGAEGNLRGILKRLSEQRAHPSPD